MFQLLERVAPLSCLALLLQLSPACTPVHRDPFSPEAVPRLPSPLGQVYTRAAQEPTDPVVRRYLEDLPWDEVLSGVAAGLALDQLEGENPTPFQIRWRGILAAWPYPILGMRTEHTDFDKAPPSLLAEAGRRAEEGMDLGMVRGRDGEGDLWVLVWSRRLAELGPIPRDPAPGQTLQLVGGSFLLADPEGKLWEQQPGPWTPAIPGEWLLEARQEDGRSIARMPIFVGSQAPLRPPIRGQFEGQPEDAAWELLASIREWYGLSALAHDPGLDAVARVRLRALLAGERPDAVEPMMRSAGYVQVPVGGADCQAPTVADCLDKIWWSLNHRAFFQGDWTAAGLAIGTRDSEMVISLVGAG